MLRINRDITNDELYGLYGGEMYCLYIKRHAMTDGFLFSVILYKYIGDKLLYVIDKLNVTNNSFATYIKSKDELDKYERILWFEVYKDIKKGLRETEKRYKTDFFKNNDMIDLSILEREKTVLKEIGKILRKQKLERILK